MISAFELCFGYKLFILNIYAQVSDQKLAKRTLFLTFDQLRGRAETNWITIAMIPAYAGMHCIFHIYKKVITYQQ